MKKKVLTIYEYKQVKLDAENNFCLSNKELIILDKLNKKLRKLYKTGTDIIEIKFLPGRSITLKANNYVGVIKVGNKTIQIIPKMAKESEGEDNRKKQAISNLLYMLSYTKKLNIKESDLASLKKKNDNFFEVLIFLFAKNLLALIQNNISKEYIIKEDNLPFIKGKLQFSNHIRLNSVTRTNFYLRYDEFCEDNILNRIFKYTTHLLIKTTNSFSNLKLLQELQFIFNDISLQRVSVDDFKKVNLTRLNKVYEPVLNLAKIFISQSSIEMNADNISTFSFVFDMNALFEEYVGEMIRRSCHDKFIYITMQRPCCNLVESKIVNGEDRGQVFNMKPDIALGQNYKYPEIIVDTKYKMLENDNKKEGVSQADMYQMNAYSKKYNCSNIILLYPQNSTTENRLVDFHIDSRTIVKIRSIDLCRDLKRDKLLMFQELRSILEI
jgi:5-methylcytosine-specific restriction enzyme subunit McrC